MSKHKPVYASMKVVYLRNNTAPPPPAPKKRSIRFMRWVTMFSAAGLLVIGIQNAYSSLSASDLFLMSQIKVVGNAMLSEGEVIRSSGLSTGGNLFACDLTSATERLADHPMIEQALMIREPPETLVISLVERQPIALVNTPGGLMGLDKTGQIFSLPSAPLDLPVVTESHRDSAQDMPRLAAFLTALKNNAPDFWRDISEVNVEKSQIVTLYLAGDGLPLRMKLEHPEQQVQNFRAFTAATSGAMVDLAYIDLRFRDQVVVGRR